VSEPKSIPDRPEPDTSSNLDTAPEKPTGTLSGAYAGKVPSRVKGAYAIGASAETIFTIAFNTFNFFFYTNLLGLSGTLAGLAITLGLFVDAFTDPLVGALSDRWRSRWGRRHPFMLVAPLPVMLCLYLLYSPPEGLGQIGLFIWLGVMAVTMRSFFTLFHVPHLAMGAELSSDFFERTRVMSLNTLCMAAGAALVYFVGLSVFFKATPEFANGLMNAGAYPQFALTAALMGGSIMLFSTIFTREVIPHLPQPSAGTAAFNVVAFKQDLKDAFRNRNYLMFLIGYIFVSATLGTKETISIHMSTYYWELATEQIRFYALALIIGPIIGYFITLRLHRRFDKKPTLIAALVALSVLTAIPVSCRILGIYPDNGSALLFPMLLANYLIYMIAGALLHISAMSALADIADEHELNTHKRQEGIFYSARSFFGKASSGLGHLLAGIALDIIDFPVGAEPGTVAADKIYALGIVDGHLAALPVAISIIFYVQYRLTREKHSEIQSALRRRNPLHT